MDTRLIAYDLPLRPNLMIRVVLPSDFTTEDAKRLCGIICTLNFTPDVLERNTQDAE